MVLIINSMVSVHIENFSFTFVFEEAQPKARGRKKKKKLFFFPFFTVAWWNTAIELRVVLGIVKSLLLRRKKSFISIQISNLIQDYKIKSWKFSKFSVALRCTITKSNMQMQSQKGVNKQLMMEPSPYLIKPFSFKN